MTQREMAMPLGVIRCHTERDDILNSEAIGWFWSSNPQTSSAGGALSVSTLSPFALAFVAGYGVELFFALLDKIVSTFTNKA